MPEIPFDKVYVRVIQRWAEQYQARRRERILSRGLSDTGALSRMDQLDIRNDTQAGIYRLFLLFEFYGRYYNISDVTPARGGRTYVERIMNWISRRGNFQLYRNTRFGTSRLPIVTTKDLEQVAWAVIKSKANNAWRTRQWIDQPQRTELEELTDRLSEVTAELTVEEIVRLSEQALSSQSPAPF